MKRAVTAAEMRRAESAASVSTMVLMERAGEALAGVARRWLGPAGRVLVYCGQGNNGGDGLVAARHLAQLGREVWVLFAQDRSRLTGDPATNLRALEGTAVRVTAFDAPDLPAARGGDVVLDALFGTGLSRAPDGRFAQAIAAIAACRAAGAAVIAADLPSGLRSDEPVPFAPCVHADATVAFGFPKLGQLLEPGASLCGQLDVVDIGLPAEAELFPGPEGTWLFEELDARAALPPRRADTHKGTYGHVLVLAGSVGKTGAAALAALGALKSGAGLVSVAGRRDIVDAVLAHAPEVMGQVLVGEGPLARADLPRLLELARGKDAVVMGPGLALGGETPGLLAEFLVALDAQAVPAVLDAEALNAGLFAGTVGAALPPPTRSARVLTPHPGELARMLNTSTASLQQHRLEEARAFAKKHRVTLVLKGARTLVASADGAVHVNPTGNPGMATAGCGDVLAGMCAAFLGQGLPAMGAASTAVYAHGLAGDLAARRTGQLGLTASDLLASLGRVWRRWRR